MQESFVDAETNALQQLRSSETPVYSGRHAVDLISESLRMLKQEARKKEIEQGHLLRALAEIAARARFAAEDLSLVQREELRVNTTRRVEQTLADIYRRLCYYTDSRHVRTKPSQLGCESGRFHMPYDDLLIETVRKALDGT